MILSPLPSTPYRALRRVLAGLGTATIWTLAAIGLFVVVFVSFTMANGNIHTVAQGEAFRSAQPSPQKLERYVQAHGIRTVINLRGRPQMESGRRLIVGRRSRPWPKLSGMPRTNSA